MAWPKHLYSPPKGKGWGGPAKGASRSRIKPGDPDGIQPMSNDADTKARRAEWREKVLNLYVTIVDDKEQPVMARIAAGDKLLDRIEGKAVQTNVNITADDVERMTDDELRAERARVDAALAEARQARASAGDQGQSDSMVH